MADKVKTMELKGNEYAKVADRILEFRSKNPNSKISTKLHEEPDGGIIAKAYVWKDKTDFYELLKAGVKAEDALESADANGTAQASSAKANSEKMLEKLETVSVGRALALLGYAVSGEIASSEEMEEFENFKKEKREESMANAIAMLEKAKGIDELSEAWKTLTKEQQLDKSVRDKKDELKGKYEDIKNPAK